MPKIGWECVCRSCHFTECTCILKRNPKSTLSKLVYLCTAGSFFLTCSGKKYICSNPHGSPEGWAWLPLVVYVFRYFLLQLLWRDDSTAYWTADEKFVECSKCMQLEVASLRYNHEVPSEQVIELGHSRTVVRASSFVRFPTESFGHMQRREKHAHTRVWSETFVHMYSANELPPQVHDRMHFYVIQAYYSRLRTLSCHNCIFPRHLLSFIKHNGSRKSR